MSSNPDYVAKILQLVPPPSKPVNSGSMIDFRRVEEELRLDLPSDYKRLIITYGDGQWQEFWSLLNPFSPNRYLNLIRQSIQASEADTNKVWAERVSREQFPAEHPFPCIYPEAGGILPWAGTDNGGTFWWITTGEPDSWQTIYDADGRSMDWKRLGPLGCAEILYGQLSGDFRVFDEEFGDDYKYGRADQFKPYLE